MISIRLKINSNSKATNSSFKSESVLFGFNFGGSKLILEVVKLIVIMVG